MLTQGLARRWQIPFLDRLRDVSRTGYLCVDDAEGYGVQSYSLFGRKNSPGTCRFVEISEPWRINPSYVP